MVRRWFFGISAAVFALVALLWFVWPPVLWSLVVLGPLFALGLRDSLQHRHTVLRNFPVVGHGRYMVEGIRPEIQQYLIESNLDAYPVEREFRALVYQRAKNELETRPFGTQRDVYRVGYEWASHSLAPVKELEEEPRVSFGGPDCTQPYSASHLNVSAMSFGSISSNAILALNGGAKRGGFAHNTGEGGVSRYHLQPGGDLVWQIGTGYFGCRKKDGSFDPERFRETAGHDSVRMIELKLSQGAKPGHGGILPAAKVTPEIAEARRLAPYEPALSPGRHSAFSTPAEMIEFVARLRELAGGKPVGIKLCVGHPWEFFAMAKAFHATGITPDFITIDGAEGGTGAAPAEFADHKGAPIREGLMLVHNTLVGMGLRDRIRLIVSGKLISAFDMCRMFALGADGCNIARGFMFAVGCIQAQVCHSGKCPTGVTTQDPGRYRALVVADKYQRVANFHRNTMIALKEAVESSGLQTPQEFTPHHLMIRVSSREVRSAASQYLWLEPGELLSGEVSHPAFAKYWDHARPDSFAFA